MNLTPIPLQQPFRDSLPKKLAKAVDQFAADRASLIEAQAQHRADVDAARSGELSAGLNAVPELRGAAVALLQREAELRHAGLDLADALQEAARAFVDEASNRFTATREQAHAKLTDAGLGLGAVRMVLQFQQDVVRAKSELEAARGNRDGLNTWRQENHTALIRVEGELEQARNRALRGL